MNSTILVFAVAYIVTFFLIVYAIANEEEL